jgi:hypothetical protein
LMLPHSAMPGSMVRNGRRCPCILNVMPCRGCLLDACDIAASAPELIVERSQIRRIQAFGGFVVDHVAIDEFVFLSLCISLISHQQRSSQTHSFCL